MPAEGSPLELGRAAATTMWGRYACLVVRRLYERGLDASETGLLWRITRGGREVAVWSHRTGRWGTPDGKASGDKLSGLMLHLGCTRIVRTARDRHSPDPDPDQEEPAERAAA